MRRASLILTLAYTVLLAVALTALNWWGERNWIFSAVLFAPPQLFLAPLALLTPFALLGRQWRLLGLHAAAAAAVLFGYMTFHWRAREGTVDPDALVLVTHNVGQGSRQQFAEFLAAQRPDVILLQDAKNRAAELGRQYQSAYVAGRGEFVCVSRHLIQQSRLLEQPAWHGRPVMARFEINFHGQPVVLYNVHMPTPRRQLGHFLSPQTVREMLDEEEAESAAGLKGWAAERMQLAEAVADVFAGETKPFLVAGDFNMPDHGYLYRNFRRTLSDAFASSGRGWGLTFPGGMRFPVSLISPWLRIDYIFTGKGWASISCETDPGGRSQHRAVAARLLRQ